MDVDQAGYDVKPGGIDDALIWSRIDFGFDARHLAAREQYVHHGVDVVASVDDVAAADQEVG